MNAPRHGDLGTAVRVHRDAQDDWFEAMGLVEDLRRTAAAARLLAQQRLRLAGDAMRSRRSDSPTISILDADLYQAWARAQAERLALAEMRLETIRARMLERERAVRAALDAQARSASRLGGRPCG